MSVPVNQRGQGKLEVCTKARDLAVYTLQITKNKKVFAEEYQTAITDKIISLALDIHSNKVIKRFLVTDVFAPFTTANAVV